MMRRNRDEHDAIFGRGPLPRNGEVLDGIGLSPLDADHSEVYGEDGEEIVCECGGLIVWRERDGVYVCRDCGQEMTRREFFNYAGVTPLGPACYTCDNPYPGCLYCHHGYKIE